MRTRIGWFLTITGLLACPCHLPLTLPLLLSVLGGTALGASLAQQTGLITLAAAAYFLAALGLGLSLLGRGIARKDGQPCCPPGPRPRPVEEQQPEPRTAVLKAQNRR